MAPPQPTPAGERSPSQVLIQMLSGCWVAQAIHAAAKLGIADLLQDGPRLPAELAQATGTHARSLYRLLRALASVGMFAEDAEGRFHSTSLAECLRSVPGSQRSLAILLGEEHFRAWGDLLYSIHTGQTAFDHLYGQPLFEYLAAHPPPAQLFDDAMTGVHGAETAPMLDAYDFSTLGTLVDIGGGNGTVLAAVLQRYPSVRGVLFDRADVVDRARPALNAAGLKDRCQVVAGDFFQAVPAGGDAYLLRHIIHDWDDDQALTILGNCRHAMKPPARLLIVESVIPPGNAPFAGKFLDLNMLVMPGGLERTEPEYRTLLQAAGFRLSRIVPTGTEVSVLEGELL